jgi:uncharacterized oligopeptide transporter (OPT) family protein
MDKDLSKQLAHLTEQIRTQNDYRQVFIRGLIAGVATAIGATIIAGIGIAVLVKVADSIPAVHNIVNELQINSKS